MEAESSIYLCMGISFFSYGMVVWRRGIIDPLVAIISFYLFFTYGPVINYLVGWPIYFGIRTSYIPAACWNFTVATVGLCLPAWLIRLDREGFRKTGLSTSSLQRILRPANLLMGMVSLGLLGKLILSGGGGPDKIRNISLVGSGPHYVYLLVEVYLAAFFFSIGPRRLDKWLYAFNFCAYVSYCLAMGERDFIFTVVALMIHGALVRRPSRRQNIVMLLGGLSLGIVATGIFVLRDSSQATEFPLAVLLNQGSLLFINTFVLSLLDGGTSFFYGQTYLNAVLNLVPSGLWDTGFSLQTWFHDHYAPGSTSGYGFGLDAEGYLNFGIAGVFATFLLLGLVQRFVFNSRHLREFSRFYSVFTCGFTMYCLRNDSTALLKGNFYAIWSFCALAFLAKFLPVSREGRE